MCQITTFRIRPIYVAPLLLEEIALGMTEEASAIFMIGSVVYRVPKKGGTIILDKPLDCQDFDKIEILLYMYDRQPSTGSYYEIITPSIFALDVVDGAVDLVFTQTNVPITFGLMDTKRFREIMSKTYGETVKSDYHPISEMVRNKDAVFAGFDG